MSVLFNFAACYAIQIIQPRFLSFWESALALSEAKYETLTTVSVTPTAYRLHQIYNLYER